ncbi:MAG: QueT transporter family protein [Saccharofermentans sp.]|nr:QueT transporter family protein [Saccharofermentans sp.]
MTELSQSAKNRKRIRFIVNNGIIAALYVILTLPFAQIAYGPLQVRLAEVMTVLPAFSIATVPGVTLGCFLANLLNPNNLGPIDIIFGTLATLIAGVLSYYIAKPNKLLGIIPPVVVNGLIVGGYLPFLLVDGGSSVSALMVSISMLEVAGSEAVLLVVLGLPLILLIKKTKLEDKL